MPPKRYKKVATAGTPGAASTRYVLRVPFSFHNLRRASSIPCLVNRYLLAAIISWAAWNRHGSTMGWNALSRVIHLSFGLNVLRRAPNDFQRQNAFVPM